MASHAGPLASNKLYLRYPPSTSTACRGDKVPEEWIRALVADFGSECRERLRVSDTEASISMPVAKLVETFGARWKLSPRLHPEYSLPEAQVRPD
jgi:hypothetical protein